MKFRLIIDQNQEEEIVATVKQRNSLVDYIQNLVEENENEIVGYLDNQIVKLNINSIECIFTQDSKTYIAYEDKGIYQIKKRLYEIEKILPPTFIRINKSAIANTELIAKYITTITGSVNVEFKSGYTDYVSRRCFAEIKRSYNLWTKM